MKTTRSYRQSARAEATVETGRRIIESFLMRLNEQWYDEITLEQVAEDAEVTVQTVIRRFGGKAGLLCEAVQAMKRHAQERRASPPGDLDQLVRHLIDDYEKSGDTVIRLLALEGRHSVLQEQLTLGRGWHRSWLQSVFADQLNGSVRECRAALDALVIATDVYTWKLLRRDMRRSIGATTDIIKGMIHAAIMPTPAH